MQNNYICKAGPLRGKTNYSSVKNIYYENYDVGIPIKYCDAVVLKLQGLTIAREFIMNKKRVTMINLVNEKYTDSNIDILEGVYDEFMNLRTNYQCICKQNNNFPPQDNQAIFTPHVIVMRDDFFNVINPQQMFTISFTTLKMPEINILEKKQKKEDSDEQDNIQNNILTQILNKDRIMSAETYLEIKMRIELALQTAHCAHMNAVIFNDFGCLKEKLPVDDLVHIFNSCILKYGHLFEEIVFAIPVRTPFENVIHNYFLENIIKPQNITIEDEEDKRQIELLTSIVKSSRI